MYAQNGTDTELLLNTECHIDTLKLMLFTEYQ